MFPPQREYKNFRALVRKLGVCALYQCAEALSVVQRLRAVRGTGLFYCGDESFFPNVHTLSLRSIICVCNNSSFKSLSVFRNIYTYFDADCSTVRSLHKA